MVIGDIAGAMLSAILLKMAIISWSKSVCCAMVEFQKELFEANTRCKTGFYSRHLTQALLLSSSKKTYKKQLTKDPTFLILHLALASNGSFWNSTMAQQTISDQEMIAIFSNMADSIAPAISPIKSPKQPRDLDSPDSIQAIPDSQPAPKKPKTDQAEGAKTIRNRLLTLETRRAKCKRSLQVLGEHAKNSTCPYGLQYRPKPHIRFDREFQTALDQISRRAHAELLTLMIKQQEKNLAADNEAIQAQQQLLKDLCPDQQSSQATRHHAANRARPRPRPPKNAPKKVQLVIS